MIYKCPICKKIIAKSSKNFLLKSEFFPFCCKRCQLIDLGVWLDGGYKVISEPPQNTTPDESERKDNTSKNMRNYIETKR